MGELDVADDYIRLAVGERRNLSVHPSLENKIQSRDKCS
jgi:hypothetical protein